MQDLTLGEASQTLIWLAAAVTALTVLAKILIGALDRRIKDVKTQVEPMAKQLNATSFTDLRTQVNEMSEQLHKLVTLAEVQGRRQDRADARMDSHIQRGHRHDG